MFENEFKGKVVLVTGGSRGIGFAAVKGFLAGGAKVYFLSHYEETGAKALAALKEINPDYEVMTKAIDLCDYKAVQELYKEIIAKWGRLDVLVNNAGITKDGLMARMSEEQYDAVIAVNQKSVFNMMKLVGTVMMRQRHGRIVSLASVAGLYGNPGQINYSASKAAIIGMTKTVAKELGARNVTVNAVAPGFIKTPMTDALTEEQRNKMLELVAMKRYGEPEEVANVISFLCSDDASYVTGQTIEISGGLMM